MLLQKAEEEEDSFELESGGPVLRSHVKESLHDPATKVLEHEMRLVHQGQLNKLWNSAIKNHPKNKCLRPEFTQSKERRKGLVVSQSLKCMWCSFETDFFKLYEEVPAEKKRGSRPAVTNVALQVALMHTSIGNDKGRTLLSALDIPVPNEKSMRAISRYVSDTLVEVADEGMAEKLQAVTGRAKAVHLKADTRYNTARPGSHRSTGLPLTSQAITLAIENNSGQNFIVGQHTQNKICVKGTAMRLKGEEVECPGHSGCTANVHRYESLTEKAAGIAIGRQMAEQGVTVTTVTTDGDAKFAKGLQEVTQTPVKRLADTTHLGQSQIRKGKNISWSENVFPGVKTRAKKQACGRALANDMKNRSFSILKKLHEHHSGKIQDIQNAASSVVSAVVMCYQGDCRHCSKETTSCAGGEGNDNWIMKSSLLQEHNIRHLNLTQSDIVEMKKNLDMVLSSEALDKTQLLSNTNCNEAANRAVSVSLPKNLKFSVNLRGRLACVVEVWNQGPGKAALRQRVRLRLPTSKGLRRFLRTLQRRHQRQKAYTRAASTKLRRRRRDTAQRQGKREWTAQSQSDYAKGQLDEIDHSYHQVIIY